jgi:aminomuconate-semialdehyde/2-hydroxymuconate-6-semialdehyde dehydrogenase
MYDVDHFINGSFEASLSGERISRENPATGASLRAVARGNAADVARAADAAQRAFAVWGRTPAAERSRILLAIAAGIDARLDELARLECEDTGKPLALARALDIPRAAANFRYFATAILHDGSESFVTERPVHAINYVLRKPLGVVGCISPWNLPLYLFTWKIAPALASGNCVIAKPSELTPTTATVLCEIARAAGLPPGVLNVVHGLGAEAGQAIVDCPQVRAISFTGGTVTGRRIAARCGERLIPA